MKQAGSHAGRVCSAGKLEVLKTQMYPTIRHANAPHMSAGGIPTGSRGWSARTVVVSTELLKARRVPMLKLTVLTVDSQVK